MSLEVSKKITDPLGHSIRGFPLIFKGPNLGRCSFNAEVVL